jgi:4-carboxymuconolactone decarboxylase
MDAKVTELIAVGASVTAHCVPCITYHLDEARRAGASDEEIADAVRIGRKVRAGSARQWDEEVAPLLPPGAAEE